MPHVAAAARLVYDKANLNGYVARDPVTSGRGQARWAKERHRGRCGLGTLRAVRAGRVENDVQTQRLWS